MSVLAFLATLPAAFDPVAADGVTGTVQLQVSTPVTVVLGKGTVTVQEGIADDPDVTLTADDDDLIAVLRGELDGVQAFLAGRLSVEGDLQLAKDMPTFFDKARLG
ncbi:SCP2 sterol-binding domain-containing protein [Actinoplanes sp. NPDC051851]|uniref:SCP2 sterol-binding domain-containing protein n=1 Tax=Actinoplanes sp. NPDC051851 TaxID=3154753 RepID=UPI003428103B